MTTLVEKTQIFYLVKEFALAVRFMIMNRCVVYHGSLLGVQRDYRDANGILLILPGFFVVISVNTSMLMYHFFSKKKVWYPNSDTGTWIRAHRGPVERKRRGGRRCVAVSQGGPSGRPARACNHALRSCLSVYTSCGPGPQWSLSLSGRILGHPSAGSRPT